MIMILPPGEDVVIKDDFKRDLRALINRHSVDNELQTPDFLLAEYVADCLIAYQKATLNRDKFLQR